MLRDLLDILACPVCLSDLRLSEVTAERENRIEEGRLHCTSCDRSYPIHRSVPRLVKAGADVVATGKRFGYQWKAWAEGGFEDKTYTYGITRQPHAEWLLQRLGEAAELRQGDWYLDAGCGAGHMTQLHADLLPNNRVVGLDMGAEALEYAASAAQHRPNVDYVQGNVMEPPFKPGAFRWGMSKGVLHHTPDTRTAFASFRRLIQKDGGLLIWIYPTHKEGPEWSILYQMRDYVFFRQGHRLPLPVAKWLSFALIAGLFPLAEYKHKFAGNRLRDMFDWFRPELMTIGQRFRSQVFLLNDTIIPKYLYIHTIQEVTEWLKEEGVAPLYEGAGFYSGQITGPEKESDPRVAVGAR